MNDVHLSAVFGALADPTRRALLARLAQGAATVTELAAPFDVAQPTISRHLRVLEDAGLIQAGKDGQRRPRRLVPGRLDEVDRWLRAVRDQWERRLDRLEEHLNEGAEAPGEEP